MQQRHFGWFRTIKLVHLLLTALLISCGGSGGQSPPAVPGSASSPAASSGPSFTLGNTALGETHDINNSNYLNAFQFTMPNQSGAVISLSVYLPGPVSPSPNNLFELAIYSDSNGNPGTLIVSSAPQAITPESWNTVSISALLSANTSYWLVYNSNGASAAFNNLSLTPGGTFVWKVQSFGTWPQTFGSRDGFSSYGASIYATLTPVGAGADTTPPSSPTNLTATAVSSTQINLSWTASSDNIGVSGYSVYRNGTQVGGSTASSYQDTALAASTTYSYTVVAFDAAGNRSAPSAAATATTGAAADTTPPSVSITAPSDGATVFGAVLLGATASDNVAVASVQFQLDGINLSAPIPAAPYTYSWPSGNTPDGRHTLSAVARDSSGNQAISTIGVVVSNNTAGATQGISNLNATNMSANSVVLSWSTSEASDSQVEYGLSATYGASTSLDSTLVSAHSVLLTGLSADTLYHFRVKSRNAAQTLAVSDDATFTTSAAAAGSINGRDVLMDSSNRILSWLTPQETSYDRILRANVNYLLNNIPTDPNNGLKLYYTHPYFDRSMTPGDWSHNPAGLYAMFVDAALAYYPYSGDLAYVSLAQAALDYHLLHGMTASSDSWAGVPYASSTSGSPEYTGSSAGDSSGVGDGSGVIEPDKVGELGYGFLKMYQFTGNTRYLSAAIQAADMLAAHVRPGDATHSPWPFRVYSADNTVREEYSADAIAPIKLFDGLIRLNLGNSAAYQSARQTAWSWLMTYPMQNNVWSNYFEDIPIRDNLSNFNQYVPLETARYLLLHPEYDPDWRTHVSQILHWVEDQFAQPQFGANATAEQVSYPFAIVSHTSRYASINALWYEKTGDPIAKEKAFRALNWATYMTDPDGFTITGIADASGTSWFSDAYGDFGRNLMAALGALPEWTPPAESHLVRSSSIVLSVSYAAAAIDYSTSDTTATEVLHVTFTPSQITANGTPLSQRSDLSLPGWTFDPSTGILRIYHANASLVKIR